MSLRQAGQALAALLVLLAVPATTTFARHHSHRDREDQGEARGVAGQFDYYLLTLSWSPTYCLTHAEDRAQCGSRGFGFVLHGLWPQYRDGGYPQQCASASALTSQAVDFGRTIFPSPKLIEHEWSRHGVCSGLDALGYFRAADRARTSIRIPRLLETPAAPLEMTGAAIARSIRDSNPAIPEHGLVVACSRGEFAEVRICLDRSLQPTSCGRDVRSSCPASPVEVPASR